MNNGIAHGMQCKQDSTSHRQVCIDNNRCSKNINNTTEYKYGIAVRCFTYNHSAYIEDALQGFAMQLCDFPVVFIIVDDASTDNEQIILRKWAESNLAKESHLWRETRFGSIAEGKLIGKDNTSFVILLLKDNHYQHGNSFKRFDYIADWYNSAKYQALCEGDDYWIDPNKLQIQYDYLESHNGCSMVFHNAFRLNISDSKISAQMFNDYCVEQNLTMYDAVNKWVVPTASMVFRNGSEFAPSWVPRISSGDLTMILLFMDKGEVHYIHRISSVYRRSTKKDSDSMSATIDGISIMKGHVQLFTSYNTGTNGKYADVLLPRIHYLSKEIALQEARNSKQYWRLFLLIPHIAKRLLSKVGARFK